MTEAHDEDTVVGAIELATEAELWTVQLATGESIQVLAQGYHREGDRYVYSQLFTGTPHFEVTSLSIPASLLARDPLGP
jgi:hypothetical protein